MYVEDIVCPAGTSSATITVENGDVFTYKTQEGKKYGPNVDCTVNYVMGDTCSKIGFGCNKIVLKGKGKKCNQGDKMVITTENKEKL